MKDVNLQHINCNSLRIATSFETKDCTEHNVYFPDHVLLFIKQGQFHFRYNKQLITINDGSFALIKKHTSLTCFKTWSEEDDGFKMIVFILNEEFIKKVALKLSNINKKQTLSDKPFILIESNTILLSLISSLEVYLKEKKDINQDIVELKTLESLIGIAQENSNVLDFISDCSYSTRTAELPVFMEHYLTENISLNELAELSGRSIASFHREFKRIFNTSPHKWIKEQRLEKAKDILLLTNKKPSEIYFELGFEDLAHFSRSFKKQFGRNPSEISAIKI